MKNSKYHHAVYLLSLFAGAALILTGCGGSGGGSAATSLPAITPVSGVPSVGTTIAPFLIDGASAVGSTVTVTQATSVVATPAGSAAPTTSYYKVTNLAPAAFYAVSFSNAQSDINIKVGGSIGLFGGSATPICSSSYVEPITEGCVAQAVPTSFPLFV